MSEWRGAVVPEVVLSAQNLIKTFQLNRRGLGGGVALHAVDGVSLTVNEVQGNRFGVNLIPHTLAQTTFGAAKIGDQVNFEVDMLARYVARLTGNPIAG